MTLEKKLVRLRKKEGMSQADVSEKLNVSRQAVSRWEAGDSRPSTENLQALCKLYNVMLERRLKANYRTGFWEMIFLHTKPLAAVPSDMRAGRN